MADDLEFDTVDWVGCAWGGHVGIVAAALTSRVRSLVAIATPLVPLPPAELRRIGVLVKAYRLLGPIPPLASAVVSALLSPGTLDHDPEAVGLVRKSFTSAPKAGMHRAMRTMMLGRPDLTETFSSLEIPVRFVTGGLDAMWSLAEATRATASREHADAVEVPGVGHLPPLEDPATTSSIVLDFWEHLEARPGDW